MRLPGTGMLLLTLAVACCSRATQTAPVPPAPAAPTVTAAPVSPDVQFMRDMIAHHAQAIEMARRAPTRSSREDIKLLAERIDASQVEETKRMTRWLQARGDTAASAHEHERHTGGHELMPGMLTAEELARLRNASGPEFDRLFLQFMIRHHEGALTMVERLFATPGGVRDAVLYQLTSNIDADQRAEIARMRAMLSTLQ